MTDDPTVIDDPRFTPALDLVHRTGAQEIQVRYSDDEEPTVWFVVAKYHVNAKGMPVAEPTGAVQYKVGADFDPLRAVFALCDAAVDGGVCVHCNRPSGFVPDFDPMPLDNLICWYQFDPELKTFRRGCA